MLSDISNIHGDFVSQLVADPAAVPALIFLSGYVGRSSLEDYTRLYLNVVLSEYLEIPSSAIRHSTPLPAGDGPLASTAIWIEADAEIIRKGRWTPETRAKFFAGPIQKTCMTPVAPPAGPTGVMNCTQAPETCSNTVWTGCPQQNPEPAKNDKH